VLLAWKGSAPRPLPLAAGPGARVGAAGTRARGRGGRERARGRRVRRDCWSGPGAGGTVVILPLGQHRAPRPLPPAWRFIAAHCATVWGVPRRRRLGFCPLRRPSRRPSKPCPWTAQTQAPQCPQAPRPRRDRRGALAPSALPNPRAPQTAPTPPLTPNPHPTPQAGIGTKYYFDVRPGDVYWWALWA
jgi:hypothetical protein